MLSDANPMVVANALAALQEIQEISGKEVLQITSHTLFKLLAALNECTEWGQVGKTVASCNRRQLSSLSSLDQQQTYCISCQQYPQLEDSVH